MANLPYNEKDISSIFDYSKQLVNKCLRDFAPDAEEHKGKGGLFIPPILSNRQNNRHLQCELSTQKYRCLGMRKEGICLSKKC